MPACGLRAATPQDGERFYAIFRAAMSVFLDALFGWNESDYRAFHERWFTAERLPRIRAIVVGERTVGLLDLEESERDLHVARIEIDPPFQRGGIGASVLRGVLDAAASSERSCSLDVFRINPARRLYERLGFRITGETDANRWRMEWRGETVLDPAAPSS